MRSEGLGRLLLRVAPAPTGTDTSSATNAAQSDPSAESMTAAASACMCECRWLEVSSVSVLPESVTVFLSRTVPVLLLVAVTVLLFGLLFGRLAVGVSGFGLSGLRLRSGLGGRRYGA